MSVPTDQAAPMRPVRLGAADHSFETRPDGALVVACRTPLGPYPDRLSAHLVRHAGENPDRTFVARRDRATGDWVRLTYGETLARAERIGAALLARGLSAERPLMILSGNSLDHAVVALAALHVGVPYAPVSPAYSTVSQDFARLRAIVELLTPGLVYAETGTTFGRAVAAAIPGDVEIVTGDGTLPDRRAISLAALEADGSDAASAVAAAHEAVGPDTIAKFLFTSGSTGVPKAVINTHRMLCANQAMIAATFPFLTEAPPVLVDWLPWHHTFGGNHNFNIVLANGGTLYIDEGRPMPGAIAETVRNLREIAPSAYFTVPKGYEALVPHLREDAVLRTSFFSRLQMTFFAAAGLPQPIWDAFDDVAVAETGERIAMLTGLGSTETSPFALVCRPDVCRSGYVGLPARGLTLKVAPVGDKREARVRGPNVTPGYWRHPAPSTDLFDEDGFLRLGDAIMPIDREDLAKGFAFDGRLNEDFKLTSGVWVSVGPMRARFLDRFGLLVRDVAIAGETRDEVAVLVFPDLAACRALAATPHADADALLADPGVRAAFADGLADLARAATGSSNRIVRALLMSEPPQLDRDEVTDKGSINQRAVLRRRADLVARLYAEIPDPEIITAGGPT